MRLRKVSATALPSMTVAGKAAHSMVATGRIVQVLIALSQLRLLHFAHRVARHFADEHDALRQLVLRQALLERCAQRVLVERRAGAGDDDGSNALAEVRMRHA